jgi:type I restriction enzyme S subunit
MKVHTKNLSELTDNSYLRADFKFAYYHDTSFVRLKAKWKGSVKLRQIISKMRNGKDFSKKVYADYETDTCYVRVNNLKPIGEFIVEDIVFLKDEEIEKFSNLFIDEGDFLITRSGTVGIAFKFIRHNLPEYIRDKDFMPAGYMIVIKIRNSFDDEHLKYFLYSSISRRYFESLACGKSQQNISQADLGKWLVPLQILKNIPVNEIKEKEQEISKLKTQIKEPKRIVDEVFSKHFKLDLKQYSDLEKKHIFGENLLNLSKSAQLRSSLKFHHPKFDFILEKIKEFKTVKLKQLLREPVRRGVQPEYEEEGEILVIKTINVNKEGYIDLTETEFVSNEFYNKVKKKAGIQQGDILITSTGEGRGKVSLYNLDEPAIVDTHISIVRCKEDVNKKYLTYFLLSSMGKNQLSLLEQAIKGTPEIYPREIEKLIVIYPSPKIQNNIVKEIETELNEQKKITEQIEKLKQEIDNLIAKAILEEETKND